MIRSKQFAVDTERFWKKVFVIGWIRRNITVSMSLLAQTVANGAALPINKV